MTQDLDTLMGRLQNGSSAPSASGWRFVVESGKHVGIHDARGEKTSPAASRIAARMLSAKLDEAAEKTASTGRSIDERLFASMTFENGFSMSLQGDTHGYACHPRERLAKVSDYDSLEVVIYHDDVEAVDVRHLGLPPEIVEKFAENEDISGPSIGCFVTPHEIAIISRVISDFESAPKGKPVKEDIEDPAP